jgi:hypothetical protein
MVNRAASGALLLHQKNGLSLSCHQETNARKKEEQLISNFSRFLTSGSDDLKQRYNLLQGKSL